MGCLEVLDAHGQRLDVALRLRWLLARLALDPRPVTRSLLAQTFWSKGGTQSLRQALYSLKALPDADQWLEVSKDTVRVQLVCDARRFEALVAARAYDEALALGPLQLFDDSSGERTEELSLWIDEQRERFEQSVRAALLGAARASLAQGELARALACVDRGLARDPLDEGLAREGMRVCAAMGEHRAALDRYEALRRGLLSKLGVEPTEQTDQLADELARAAERAGREGAPWVLDARPADARTAYASARRWLGAEPLAQIVASLLPDSASVVRAPLGEAALRWAVADALAQRAQGALVVLDALHHADPHSALALLDAARHRAMRVALYGATDALDPSVRRELELAIAQRAVASIVAPQESRSQTAASTERARPMDERFAALSRDARRVAQWLAIEPGADDALLDVVLTLRAPERESALEELERAALLERRAWRSHEDAAAIRETLSESVARGWHRTAALSLAARGEHELAARHFLACGERASAVRGTILGAERCCALFATSEARALLDRIEGAELTSADRYAVAAVRERIAALEAKLEERERWVAAMQRAAHELQRDEAMIEAQLRAIAVLRERGLYAEALSQSEQCERECARASLPLHTLRARSERAIALLRTGSMDEAERAFDGLARESDAAAVAVGEYGLGAVRGYRLDLDGARAMHERVLTAARARGDLGVVVRALNGLAATAERGGRRRQAAVRFDESAQLARRIRDHEGARMAEVNAALAWVFGGRPGAALALLDAERPEERALLRPRALEEQARAELWLELGRFALARSHFDACVALAEQGHDRRRAAHAMLDRAFCERDWPSCERAVRDVLEREREHTQDVAALSWLELALIAPDPSSVRALLAQAGDKLGPVASLLAMMARVRVGEDAGAALDRALDESETSFSLLGLRLLCARREGAARTEAEQRFDRAWKSASEGLDPAHAARWRAWIDARASVRLDACWTREAREPGVIVG